jgi:hypothetical protein
MNVVLYVDVEEEVFFPSVVEARFCCCIHRHGCLFVLIASGSTTDLSTARERSGVTLGFKSRLSSYKLVP